jgi:hypothetical protein
MIELSSRSIEVIEILFSSSDAVLAKELLISQCAENVPMCEDHTPEQMDRIRLAALKVSGGVYSELIRAVKLACTDWRDLFMAAGFGNDIEAHLKWVPQSKH